MRHTALPMPKRSSASGSVERLSATEARGRCRVDVVGMEQRLIQQFCRVLRDGRVVNECALTPAVHETREPQLGEVLADCDGPHPCRICETCDGRCRRRARIGASVGARCWLPPAAAFGDCPGMPSGHPALGSSTHRRTCRRASASPAPGFEPAADLSFDADGGPALIAYRRHGPRARGGGLFGLPLVRGELDPCWACGGCSCDHDHTPRRRTRLRLRHCPDEAMAIRPDLY